MDHEAEHEREVEKDGPGNRGDADAVEAHRGDDDELEEVVHVTGKAPVAASQQAGLARLASVVFVLNSL